jgi:hypothetical protein
MSNSMSFGIKVKSAEMKRAVWVSPRGTTALKMHASGWDTKPEAETAATGLQELNPTLAFSVARLMEEKK